VLLKAVLVAPIAPFRELWVVLADIDLEGRHQAAFLALDPLRRLTFLPGVVAHGLTSSGRS
jgi:hypothetical protein